MVFSRRLTNGSAVPSFLASCGTLVAATPLVIWAYDSLFCLCRIRGSSMEPTLLPGDIIVTRKADGFWQRWKLSTSSRTIGEEENDHNKRSIDVDERSIERERILAYEREHCNSNGSIGLLRKPPTPVTGNIVVFKDPKKYPDRWNIERVVAIGGETIVTCSTNSNIKNPGDNVDNIEQEGQSSLNRLVFSSGKKETKLGSTIYVPPYCIWVEGDNRSASTESRTRVYGPVSKKLLVGIAEYRIWPPWRIGKLDNQNIPS